MTDAFGFGSVVLPPHVRDSLLEAGPGRYSWQRRTFEVIKVGRNLLTIIEIDPNARAAAKRPARRTNPEVFTIGSVLAAGTLALIASVSVQGNVQRTLLLCASVLAFIMAGITAIFSERRP